MSNQMETQSALLQLFENDQKQTYKRCIGFPVVAELVVAFGRATL